MDIKRRTCYIWTWKKTFISRHIFHQHWYICPIALPVCRNPQPHSLFTFVSAISEPSFQLLRHQRNFCRPVVNRFRRQTFPTVNRKHFFMNIFCTELFWLQITHNRTLLFVSTLLKYGRHFDYWNQSMNMRMRVCDRDCHEAGLCCYLVIHIENLLRPLQLFYFHVCPIYWLSLVYSFVSPVSVFSLLIGAAFMNINLLSILLCSAV
jgi:hypothetical protein